MATVDQSRGDPAAALMGPLPTPPGRTGDASELARESDGTRLKIRELSERYACNRKSRVIRSFKSPRGTLAVCYLELAAQALLVTLQLAAMTGAVGRQCDTYPNRT